MLKEQDRKKLDNIVFKMEQNKESQDTIQFVVDDFKRKYDVPKINQQPKNSNLVNLINKAGDISGKVLDTATKYSGIKSAIDLLGTAGEGFQYAANKLWGDKEANKRLLANPQSEISKTAATKGTVAGLKDVAGKSLEVGLAAAPFAKGAQAVSFTGKLAKQFPTLARYAGYGAQGAKYGAGFSVAAGLQENKNTKKLFKEAITGATTGALIGVSVPAVVEGTVRAVKNVAALYSGVPKDALERAFNNPEVVGEAARKYAKTPEATQEILNKANDSFDMIKEARGNAYAEALQNLDTKTIKQTKLSTAGLKQNLREVIKGFNRKILSNTENAQIDELQKLINEWDDFSPLGLNDLRRAFRNRINIGNSKELNKIITSAEDNLRTYINNKVPEIAKMNAQYAKDSEFIDNLQREIFGSTSKMSDSTKLNRLLNIFNQKSDLRKQLIEMLGQATGTDLLNEIAGAAMSSWLPTGWVQRFVLAGSGLSGIVNPSIVLAAPAASPRIVGKSARVLGQTKRLTPALNKYGQPLINKIINQK